MPLFIEREVDLVTSDQPRQHKPCGYANCNNKPVGTVVMRLGGRDRDVPVCQTHRDRVAA